MVSASGVAAGLCEESFLAMMPFGGSGSNVPLNSPLRLR
mgnify:CR=1 FL=1